MIQSAILFPVISPLDLCIDPQVHVAVDGGIVVPYGQALGGGEQGSEVVGRGGYGIGGQRFVVVLWHVVRWHIICSLVELLVRGRGVRFNRSARRLHVPATAAAAAAATIRGAHKVVAAAFYARMACLAVRQRWPAVAVLGRRRVARAVAVCTAARVRAVARLVLPPMYVSRHGLLEWVSCIRK